MNLRILSVLLVLSVPALPAGFTEPPIVFYGKVTNTFDGQSLEVTAGQLTFTIQPASGAPIAVSTRLRPITGGYSYRLEIPVEKVPAGFTVSASTVATTSTSYTRDPITLDGAPVTIVLPALPAGRTFAFGENQRGKIERVDLVFATAFLDSDEDGLPDWWEDRYGFDKFDAGDATRDDDTDTANNRIEYAELTNPGLYEFDYPRWANLHALAGADRPMSGDADRDGVPNGVEFGVDTNPWTPDAPLSRARISTAIETIGPQQFLVMSVAKPARRRTRTLYKVERSLDLATWGSAEGTQIVTLQNDLTGLRVRLRQGMGDPAVPAAFLRLVISETP